MVWVGWWCTVVVSVLVTRYVCSDLVAVVIKFAAYCSPAWLIDCCWCCFCVVCCCCCRRCQCCCQCCLIFGLLAGNSLTDASQSYIVSLVCFFSYYFCIKIGFRYLKSSSFCHFLFGCQRNRKWLANQALKHLRAVFKNWNK